MRSHPGKGEADPGEDRDCGLREGSGAEEAAVSGDSHVFGLPSN